MKNIFTPIALLLITVGAVYAQNQFSLDWANTIGKAGYEPSTDIVADAQKNSYVLCNIDDTIDFDPGPGVYNISPPFDDPNISTAVVAKYDSLGNIIWAKAFYPMNNTSYSAAYHIDISSTTVAIHMVYNGTIDMDPGPAVNGVTNSGYIGCLISMSLNGNVNWTSSLKNVTMVNTLLAIAGIKVNTVGEVFIAASIQGTYDMDPGAGSQNFTGTLANFEDVLVAKYNSNGSYGFCSQFKYSVGLSTGYQPAVDVDIDNQNNVYVTGYFGGTMDFDPGPGNYSLSTGGYTDMFLAKVTSTGAFGFAYKCNSPSTQSGSGGYSIEIVNNSIYVSGSYRGTVDVDITAGGVMNVVGNSVNSPFIAKYTMAGALTFIKLLPTRASEAFKTLKYDSGKLYAAGDLYDTLDVDPTAAVYNLLTTGGSGADMMVSRYDTLGNFLSAFAMGSNGQQQLADVAVKGNRLFTTGPYQNSMDVDPSPATYTLASNGSYDMSLLSYVLCNAGPAQPGVIAGPISVCNGSSNTYSIGAVNGATSYTWTLPNGWTGSSTTTSINTTAGTNGGTISVVANNGCGASASQLLAVIVNPVYSTNATASICQGDSMLLAGAYQKTAGSYTDMLQSIHGCDSTVVTVLSINPLPTITTTGDTAICAGGTATLIAYGASNYTWQPGNLTGQTITVNPNQLTTYVVEGTDQNGCKNTATIIVTVNPLPTVTMAGMSPLCADNPAITLTNGLPIGGTYSGPGVSNSMFNPAVAGPGTHTITYTYTDANTGCSNYTSKTITVNPLPAVPTITTNGNTFTSSAASGNQWYMNGNAVNGATSQTFTCTANGNYTVCVTDANGCKSCSTVLNFTTFGISENQNENEVSVYPNPFSTEITLSLSKGEAQAIIYNTLGEVIYSSQLKNQPVTINLNEVPTGIYFVQVTTAESVISKRIVKK